MLSSVSTAPGRLTPAPRPRQGVRRSAAPRHRPQVPEQARPVLTPSFRFLSPSNECPKFFSTRCSVQSTFVSVINCTVVVVVVVERTD